MGGVLGSLVVGFGLLPLVGSQGSYMIVVLLNLALFMILVASQRPLRGDRRLHREGALGVVFLMACGFVLGRNYLKESLTNFQGAEVLAFRESPDATFVVLGYQAPHTGRYQQLVVNGTSYANNSPPGRRYMSTLGHLPALLHADPHSALVISIGTGTTIGSLTLHPRLERIWAVDIAPRRLRPGPAFRPAQPPVHRVAQGTPGRGRRPPLPAWDRASLRRADLRAAPASRGRSGKPLQPGVLPAGEGPHEPRRRTLPVDSA